MSETTQNTQNLTQKDIDALMSSIEAGTYSVNEVEDRGEWGKRIAGNFKSLEYAIKRADLRGCANVSPEDLPERLRSVHHYAHRNWLYKRGFLCKTDFRIFMNTEAEKRGMRLNWGRP